MEKVNKKISLYTQFTTFLIIWAIILYFSNNLIPFNLLSALKKIPTVFSIYIVVGYVFTKWIWRWQFLHGWLIKIPDIRGTWRGELKSYEINPKTGMPKDPIPVILVVKQTFISVSCTLFSKESSSYSISADINRIHGSDIYLIYNYNNRPKITIQDKSPIHDGTALLKIITKPRALEGGYWTSRMTRGDIYLHFESRLLVERFE